MRFFLLIFLAFPLYSSAQNSAGEAEDDPYEDRTYFMWGGNYLSNNVYLGRKDTARVPYLSPYIGYHHKSGIYAKAMLSYAPLKNTVDLLTLEGGYEHTFGDHITTGADLAKYIYNKNTTTIRGNIREGAGAWFQYTNDLLQPLISFDVNFARKTDYIVGLSLNHPFKLVSNTLSITPTATLNSGTQHFYDDYFITRLLKQDKTLKINKVLANAGRFKPLDAEISLPVTYRYGKYLYTLTPTYAIPLNPNTITLPKQTIQEHLSNTFYVELDIRHR